MPAENKNKKRKVTCLGDECTTEFELDENGDGSCPNCGLNMGAVLNRDRHERALQKLRDARKPADPPQKKSKDPFGLS